LKDYVYETPNGFHIIRNPIRGIERGTRESREGVRETLKPATPIYNIYIMYIYIPFGFPPVREPGGLVS